MLLRKGVHIATALHNATALQPLCVTYGKEEGRRTVNAVNYVAQIWCARHAKQMYCLFPNSPRLNGIRTQGAHDSSSRKRPTTGEGLQKKHDDAMNADALMMHCFTPPHCPHKRGILVSLPTNEIASSFRRLEGIGVSHHTGRFLLKYIKRTTNNTMCYNSITM